MKTCTKCGDAKPLTDFYASCARCKSCIAAERKAHYAQNRGKILQYKQQYQVEAREKRVAAGKAYRESNRERLAAYGKTWREANAERLAEWRAANKARRNQQTRARRKTQRAEGVVATQKRRAAKYQALTNWDPELDQLVFAEAAALAKQRETMTGIKWHVDHVIPLRHKAVCGLHNAYNLAVIPAANNLHKSNTFIPGI